MQVESWALVITQTRWKRLAISAERSWIRESFDVHGAEQNMVSTVRIHYVYADARVETHITRRKKTGDYINGLTNSVTVWCHRGEEQITILRGRGGRSGFKKGKSASRCETMTFDRYQTRLFCRLHTTLPKPQKNRASTVPLLADEYQLKGT